MDSNKLDDPIWEYVLATKLQPYLPAVKKFWEDYDKIDIKSTGVYPINYEGIETPPGLFFRMTNTPVRSPIKHVQAFPYVQAAFLQITGVVGGVNKMIERVCYDNRFVLEDFVIIEKHNLPSTYQNGQLLAFVPKKVLEGAEALGKFVYLTLPELCSIAQSKLPASVIQKCARYK